MAKSKVVEKKASAKTKGEEAQDLPEKEYTEEEKARLAHYRKRCEKKPPRVKKVEGDPGKPPIALKDPDDPLVAAETSISSHFLRKRSFAMAWISEAIGLRKM